MMDWQTIAAIAASLPLIGLVIVFIRKVNHFIDDYFGEKARPGVPAQPGVKESIAILAAEVEKVKHQVQNDHPTNLRDDMDELKKTVDTVHEKLDGHLSQQPGTTVNVNTGGPE